MPKMQLDVGESVTLPDVKIPVSGALNKDDLKVSEIETDVNLGSFSEHAAELAFNEEPVTIFLHETTDPNAEGYAFCGVNGEYPIPGVPWLKRGMEHTIARKFVANLATAKVTSFTQPFARETSDKANYMRPHTAVRYPFSILRDSNTTSKAQAWAKQMMGA